LFTGVPIAYDGNPLYVTDISMSRCMVIVNGVYHLFEERSGSNPNWWIRKRTSTDGLKFTNFTAPLFLPGGAGTYDVNGQADPTVIYDGVGDWKMWFDASGPSTWDKLGYATSTDGDIWTKYGSILNRGAAGSWDDTSVHHPCCVKHNGVYYLFYSGSKSTDGGRVVKHIGLATSTDGINWTKEATNPVIPAGTGSEWDNDYVRPSCPVLILGTWYMWYWGFDGTDHSMGLATSTNLITWTKKGQVLTTTGGIQGSSAILKQGSNIKDVLVELWYTATTGNSFNYTNVTLPTLLTKLSRFLREEGLAVYGDNTGAGTPASYLGGYIYFCRITVTSQIDSTAIRVYFNATSKPTTATVKCALYANGSDAPTTLLGITEELHWSIIRGGEWTEFNLASPITLTPGDYWIATWSDNQDYQRSRGGAGSKNWGNLYPGAYGTFPDPIVGATIVNFSDFDAYITGARANRYEIDLVSEPIKVYFNNILGNKQTSKANVDSEFDWYWTSGKLLVYSDENPDVRYQITYE
jgi:hypothetical protein